MADPVYPAAGDRLEPGAARAAPGRRRDHGGASAERGVRQPEL